MGRTHFRVLGKMVPIWVALFRLLKKAPKSLPSLEMAPNLVMKAMRCGALQTESLRYADNYRLANTDIIVHGRRPPKALLPSCTSRPLTDSFRVHDYVVSHEAPNYKLEEDRSGADLLHVASHIARASTSSTSTAARSSTDSEQHYSTAHFSIDQPISEGNSSTCSSSPRQKSTTSDTSDGLEAYCDAVSSTQDQLDSTEEEEDEDVMASICASIGTAATSSSSRPSHGDKFCQLFDATAAKLPAEPSMDSPFGPTRVMEFANSRGNSNPTPMVRVTTAPSDSKSRRPSSMRPQITSALNRKQMCRQQNGSRLHADMAVVQYSEDPLSDFASSIAQMVVLHQMRDRQDLEDLFSRYLRLNAPEYHRTIALAFLHAMEHLSSFDQHLATPSQSHNPSCAHLR